MLATLQYRSWYTYGLYDENSTLERLAKAHLSSSQYRVLIRGVHRTPSRWIWRSLYAASARWVGRNRKGLPPGGSHGLPSSTQSASRISSIVTGAFRPLGARSAGHEAIADASEAQEARMARFSANVSVGWLTTSRG